MFSAEPELLVLAGRVHSFHGPTRPRHRATAVAVRGGRIIAVGTPERARAALRRGAPRLDLRGATLTPGLVDAHTHFFYWALQRSLVIDVTSLPTRAATLAELRRHAPRRRVGDWVIGRGFDPNLWGAFPTAADLDGALPGTAVMVRSRDGHSAWLSSAALRRAGLAADTPDPPGGRYLRDASGALNGIVQEAAINTLPDPLRDFGLDTTPRAVATVDRALHTAYEVAWSLGITGVHSMDDAPSLAHFQRQRQSGTLGLRIAHAVPLAQMEQAIRLGLRPGLGDDWLRVCAIKIFSDGALGSQTALMFDPYPGRGDYVGVAVVAGAELRERAVFAARHGWPVWVHAIGDRAVSETVDAIAAARRVEPTPLPHRIEHVQAIRPADIRRMARLGIHASMQPCHLVGDIASAERHWPVARRRAYLFRSLLDAGVNIAAGSDVPVETIDPRLSLHAAVTRTDRAAAPAGGWFPRERISVEETLRAFTVGAHLSLLPPGAATLAGRIHPGAPADMTIWHDDPLAAAPESLARLRIAGCILNGTAHLAGA